MKRLVLALLLATGVAAQPQLGPEHQYGPYFARRDAGVPAFAATKTNMLQVWSEMINGVARIRAQRLDINANPIGAIFDLPSVDSKANAVTPMIASNGTEYLVVWHEWAEGAAIPNVVAMMLDGRNRVILPPAVLQHVMRFTGVSSRGLAATWTGSEFLVLGLDTRWRLTAAGTLQSTDPLFGSEAYAVAGSGAIFAASAVFTPGSFRCVPGGFSPNCRVFPDESTLTWRLLNATGSATTTASRRLELRGGTPSMAARASDVLIVWQAGNLIEAVRIRADGVLAETRSLGMVPGFPTDATPRVAYDGRRYLVAWRNNGHIAAVTLDDAGWSQPITIPASEHEAIGVHGVIPGRFVLVWSSATTERTHAWRTLTFEPLPLRRRPTR